MQREYAGSVQAHDSAAGWERVFWFVFGQSTNPMCLLGEDRRVVEVNDAALALLQRSRGDVIGRPGNDFLAPSDRPRAEGRWQVIQQTESGEYDGVATILRPDRSEVEIDFAARMVRLTARRLAVYVWLIRGARPLSPNRPRGAERALTKREREIVTEIAMGKETPQIAEDLHISRETVRTHVRNAMTKLNAHTRAQLVAEVVSADGLLHLPHLEE
jgi:DNA-binding CsgD family transcriptional regulator